MLSHFEKKCSGMFVNATSKIALSFTRIGIVVVSCNLYRIISEEWYHTLKNYRKRKH